MCAGEGTTTGIAPCSFTDLQARAFTEHGTDERTAVAKRRHVDADHAIAFQSIDTGLNLAHPAAASAATYATKIASARSCEARRACRW
jgi:hypothetical protein